MVLSTNSNQNSKEFTLTQYVEDIRALKGTFVGEIQWANTLPTNDAEWKTHYLRISSKGSLIHLVNNESIKEFQQTLSATTTDNSIGNSAIVKDLHGCELRLIDSFTKIPVLEVTTAGSTPKTVYLRVRDKEKFEELFTSLTFWSMLASPGIFNKVTLLKNETCLSTQKSVENLLVCQMNVYGPISNSKLMGTAENMKCPEFVKLKNKPSECGWFSAMAVLKSNGYLQLLSQNDGSSIMEVNIGALLRSEIRILDLSMTNERNCLWLGRLQMLRNRLKVNSNEHFVKNDTTCQELVLKFPLRIDLDDWFLALRSYAIAEYLALIGSDKSNNIRVSNKFKISIIEADLEGINLKSEEPDTSVFVEISFWDHMWAKTPALSNLILPFWREEFDFDETIKVDSIDIRIIQSNSNIEKVLGSINLSYNNLADGLLLKETRLPIYASENKDFQVGTLCLKVEAELEMILPSVNFNKLEKSLLSVPISDIAYSVYGYLSSNPSSRLEKASVICLDMFQALGLEDSWIQSLIDIELSNTDELLHKSSSNNVSSNNIYNSLFRGNSLLTKTLEKYFFRVGYEYLDKSIGIILREIITLDVSCEIDPSRISGSNDEKAALLAENYSTLMEWSKRLWQRIYETSNDLPVDLKNQLKTLRKRLEKVHIERDVNFILNSVSSILFLRFFCPVILNPKLFNFTKYHLNENSRRSLTLISKILLNLSTSTNFGAKEPWMNKVNNFIESSKDELIDYLDKITQKKLDFTPKYLKLENNVTRPKLLMNKQILKDLPINSYLIDKYLRETQFLDFIVDQDSLKKDGLRNQTDGSIVDASIIGELEFENITENNAEIFGDDFMDQLRIKNDDDESSEHASIEESKYKGTSMVELKQEASLLKFKINRLIVTLSDSETLSPSLSENSKFITRLARSLYYSGDKRIVIDRYDTFAKVNGYLKVFNPNSTKLFSFTKRESMENLSLNTTKSKDKSKDSVDHNQTRQQVNGNSKRLSRLAPSKLSKIIRGTNDISELNSESSHSEGKKSVNSINTTSARKLSRWFKISKDNN